MAEYLNYGDLQIELLALLNNLANEVQGYVAKLPWSNKRKEKFMSAYADIMNRGLKGASNTTGQWTIDVGGTSIPWDSMSKKDKEMYLEAAYFIRNQMASLPTKASEEEKKKDIPKYGKFMDNFVPFTSKTHYGGNDIKTSEWNELDERDAKTGIRGTKVRQERLANYLLEYLESLNDKEYDFEGSAFSGIDDLKSRLNNAITKLRDENWNLDDKDALNALGLNYSDWFNNGSGDPSDMVDLNGNRLNWALKALYEQALAKQQQDLKIASEKALAQRRFTGLRHYTISNLNGTQLTEESLAKLQDNLNNFRQLDGNDLSRLAWAIKNGNLIDVPKEELDLLAPEYRNNPKRLKKISGIEGIYYDTIGQRLYQPYNEGQTGVSTILDIISLNNPEAKKLLAAVNMNTAFKDIKEFTPEMKKELEALAWDVASIINPEAFSGSAMALNAARLRDKANPNRSSLEKWFDYGTASLGGIQGFGDLLVTGKLGYRLYLLGKSIGSVSKFAGMLGAGFGAIGAWNARDSIMKITDPKSLTPLDIENISYGLMGLIGLKSFATARNKLTIGKQANPTVTEHNINIVDKNGKTHKVKVDETTAKEINSNYKLGSKKSDTDILTFNHEKVKKAVKEYNDLHPTEKLELEGASILSSSKLGRITKKDAVKSEQVKNPNAPLYEPVGTRYWFNPGYIPTGNRFKWAGWQRRAWENAAPEKSSKGIIERIKDFYSPEPKPINRPEETSSPSSEINIPAGRSDERGVIDTWILENPILRNAFNPSSAKMSRETRIPTPKNSNLKRTLANGEEITFKFDNTKDQITVELPAGSKLEAPELKGSLHEQKAQLGKWLTETNTKILKDLGITKKNDAKWDAFVKQIKELKRKGYLFKQGGKITDSQIDNFLKRYK